MHAVRGVFRLANIDGLIVSDPAVHARHPGPPRRVPTQGLDRLQLIRFLQVAQTISSTVALAYLLGINALRALIFKPRAASIPGAARSYRRDSPSVEPRTILSDPCAEAGE